MEYSDKIYDMDLREYATLYDMLVMNLTMVQDEDIEFFDEISDFIDGAAYYNADVDCYEGRYKRSALIKFFKINKNIGYHGNIFLDKSGTEIYYQLREFYEEAVNLFDY